VNSSIRKALIVHRNNVAYNHPRPALKKASFELRESYRQCIKAAGTVGATVAKEDNGEQSPLLNSLTIFNAKPSASSTKVLLAGRQDALRICGASSVQTPQATARARGEERAVPCGSRLSTLQVGDFFMWFFKLIHTTIYILVMTKSNRKFGFNGI
jgi:hypothetical protein